MNNARALLAAALIGLAACQQQQQAEPPLAGARIGGPFTLTDQDGRRISDTRFAGKYRLAYFGYTYCPDVCPVDMQVLMKGLKLFEAQSPALAAKVQPLFFTVDPERDTPAVLKQWVAAFHPRLIGLTGTPAEVAAVAKEYAVYYKKVETPGSTSYLMDHARQAVLFGPKGEPLALIPQDTTPEAAAAELAKWGAMTDTADRFWETIPLARMTRAQWESLCDGCGKCCIHKLEDDETGELYPTNIACKLLDRRTGQCSDYRRRHAYVPECVRLTPAKLRELDWLPTTCAYRLIDEGKPLADWHHLVSGDRETVHTAGISVRGWTVSETDVGDFENHIVDRIL